MVAAGMYARFLKEQKIKEKKKKEKDEAEKKYQEEVEKYASERRLVRLLENKLDILERSRKESVLNVQTQKKKEAKKEELLRLRDEIKFKKERLKRKEAFLKVGGKKKLCKSLQEIISNVKDPDSIFTDIDLVREYTGCPIPVKKKIKKK